MVVKTVTRENYVTIVRIQSLILIRVSTAFRYATFHKLTNISSLSIGIKII